MNAVKFVLFLFGHYQTTVMFVNAASAIAVAVVAGGLYKEVLPEEKWLKYLGRTFIVLAIQYVLFMIYPGFTFFGLESVGAPLGKPIVGVLIAICSALSNLFLLATARALLGHKPHVPDLAAIAALVSAVPSIIATILSIIGGIVEFDLWQTRILDAIFSAACLWYLGWAMAQRIMPRLLKSLDSETYRRRKRTWRISRIILWGMGFYAVLNFLYAFIPLAEDPDIQRDIGSDPVMASDAAVFAIAFVLKLLMISGAALLIARALVAQAPGEIRRTLKTVTEGRQEYLASQGILRAISRNVSADVIEVCMKLPGLRQQNVVWWRWMNDDDLATATFGQRKSVDFEFEEMPSPNSRAVRALSSGRPHSSRIPSPHHTDPTVVSEDSVKYTTEDFHPSWVAVPISYHGAVIGAINLEWSVPNILTPTLVQQIGLFGDLLAPVVEGTRQMAAILELGKRFHKHEIRRPDLTYAQLADGLSKQIHGVVSPLATGLAIDIGFGCAWSVHSDEEEMHDSAKELDLEMLKNRIQELVQVDQKPVDVVSTELSFQDVTLGHLVFAVFEEADEQDRPTLVKDWLLRDTVARMVSDAIFDAVRVKLWDNLNQLQLHMSEQKVKSLDNWFAVISEAIIDAGLLWVVASCPGREEQMGEPEAIGVVRNLTNLAERMPQDNKEAPVRYQLHEPAGRTRHVLELALTEDGARLWLGVERPGFSSELYRLWPWAIYLERLAEVASGALAQIEVDRLKDEAWEFRGIATASIITGAHSHEMGNLALNILKTSKDLGKRLPKIEDGEIGEKIEKRLSWLKSSAHRIHELTVQIQDVTKIDRLRPCDLHKAATKVEALYYNTLKQRHIEFDISFNPKLVVDLPAFAPAVALANLVGNSIHSIGTHGKIEVSTREHNGCVECLVTDSGQGIQPEIQGEIFKNGFSTRDNGTGIGLYLSQKILGEYGAEIRLVSGAPGNTQFMIHMQKPDREKGDRHGDNNELEYDPHR